MTHIIDYAPLTKNTHGVEFVTKPYISHVYTWQTISNAGTKCQTEMKIVIFVKTEQNWNCGFVILYLCHQLQLFDLSITSVYNSSMSIKHASYQDGTLCKTKPKFTNVKENRIVVVTIFWPSVTFSRSSKVKGQDHVQLRTYGFLIVPNSKYVSICYYYDVMQKAPRIAAE